MLCGQDKSLSTAVVDSGIEEHIGLVGKYLQMSNYGYLLRAVGSTVVGTGAGATLVYIKRVHIVMHDGQRIILDIQGKDYRWTRKSNGSGNSDRK